MFRFRASLLLYCHSPDGATTELTQRCCGECRSSIYLVLKIFKSVLLALKSHGWTNGWFMDKCYEQLGVWHNFDIP